MLLLILFSIQWVLYGSRNPTLGYPTFMAASDRGLYALLKQHICAAIIFFTSQQCKN